jgi:hypothetical protein
MRLAPASAGMTTSKTETTEPHAERNALPADPIIPLTACRVAKSHVKQNWHFFDQGPWPFADKFYASSPVLHFFNGSDSMLLRIPHNLPFRAGGALRE